MSRFGGLAFGIADRGLEVSKPWGLRFQLTRVKPHSGSKSGRLSGATMGSVLLKIWGVTKPD